VETTNIGQWTTVPNSETFQEKFKYDKQVFDYVDKEKDDAGENEEVL